MRTVCRQPDAGGMVGNARAFDCFVVGEIAAERHRS